MPGRSGWTVDGVLSDWHAGAGLGLRLAKPVSARSGWTWPPPVGGDTGDGVQVYIGLGQSF